MDATFDLKNENKPEGSSAYPDTLISYIASYQMQGTPLC